MAINLTDDINDLISENKNLIYFVINKSFKQYLSNDDIIQEGYIGLWKAIKTYDDSHSSFSTYAIKCIYNNILMYIRDNLSKLHDNILSLDYLYSGEKEETEGDLYNYVKVEEEYIKLKIDLLYKPFIKTLSKKEQMILYYNFLGYTQTKIGEKLNCSQKTICMYLSNIRKKLKKYLKKD